jgi:hypothetical protein
MKMKKKNLKKKSEKSKINTDTEAEHCCKPVAFKEILF